MNSICSNPIIFPWASDNPIVCNRDQLSLTPTTPSIGTISLMCLRSWWLLLHDLQILGSRVWRSCRSLPLPWNHLRRILVHTGHCWDFTGEQPVSKTASQSVSQTQRWCIDVPPLPHPCCLCPASCILCQQPACFQGATVSPCSITCGFMGRAVCSWWR